jgi:hypothetical protein
MKEFCGRNKLWLSQFQPHSNRLWSGKEISRSKLWLGVFLFTKRPYLCGDAPVVHEVHHECEGGVYRVPQTLRTRITSQWRAGDARFGPAFAAVGLGVQINNIPCYIKYVKSQLCGFSDRKTFRRYHWKRTDQNSAPVVLRHPFKTIYCGHRKVAETGKKKGGGGTNKPHADTSTRHKLY